MNNNFFKDYEKKDGKYIYVGDVYEIDLDSKSIDKLMKKMWLSLIGLFILGILSGLIPFKGMIEAPYLIILFGIELVIILLMLWGTMYFSNCRYGLTKMQYNKSVKRFKNDTIVLVIVELASIISAIIFEIIDKFDGILFFVVFVVIKILGILVNISINKRINSLNFKIISSKKE